MMANTCHWAARSNTVLPLLLLLHLSSVESGRSIRFAVIDIACRMDAWWRKKHNNQAPPLALAVGPWHALAHVAPCQRKYGARFQEGMGLTFGDNIEHVWAWLRAFGPTLKYASPAGRKDAIQDLVSYVWHVDSVVYALHLMCTCHKHSVRNCSLVGAVQGSPQA